MAKPLRIISLLYLVALFPQVLAGSPVVRSSADMYEEAAQVFVLMRHEAHSPADVAHSKAILEQIIRDDPNSIWAFRAITSLCVMSPSESNSLYRKALSDADRLLSTCALSKEEEVIVRRGAANAGHNLLVYAGAVGDHDLALEMAHTMMRQYPEEAGIHATVVTFAMGLRHPPEKHFAVLELFEEAMLLCDDRATQRVLETSMFTAARSALEIAKQDHITTAEAHEFIQPMKLTLEKSGTFSRSFEVLKKQLDTHEQSKRQKQPGGLRIAHPGESYILQSGSEAK